MENEPAGFLKVFHPCGIHGQQQQVRADHTLLLLLLPLRLRYSPPVLLPQVLPLRCCAAVLCAVCAVPTGPDVRGFRCIDCFSKYLFRGMLISIARPLPTPSTARIRIPVHNPHLLFCAYTPPSLSLSSTTTMPAKNPRIIALFDVDGTLTAARKVRVLRPCLTLPCLGFANVLCVCLCVCLSLYRPYIL